MSDTRDGDPGSRRGLRILSVLIGGAALLLFAAVVKSRREGDDAAPRPDKKATAPPPVASARPDPATASRPVAAPTVEASPAQVEYAMDQSNARALIQTLVEAAATENPPLRASMITAIGRYGQRARPLILEELNRASPPLVRKALEEALARANW